MADGAARDIRLMMESTQPGAARRRARLFPVSRKGPVLQPAKGHDPHLGIYGLDLTAGCGHGCAYCHIRASSRYPGEGKILFDPSTTERLLAALERLSQPPRRVVLSPSSDPLPPDRDVRAETLRVVRTLLERSIPVQIMTRGRIGRPMIELLAAHATIARVAVGLSTLHFGLSRALEPAAAAPAIRLRDLERLVRAGVPVEVRAEPLIAGLTDTRENLAALFAALTHAGVRDVVTHYLFLHPAMLDTLTAALTPLGWAEKLQDSYAGGPMFTVGSVGTTKHLPVEVRRAALARLLSWGAEFGLQVSTGQAQNPDLPRLEPPTRPSPQRRDWLARPIASPRFVASPVHTEEPVPALA